MNRTNVEFLKNQINRALAVEAEIYSHFRIDFDPTEKADPKTNFDEIMTHWALPKKLNRDLSLDEVCESLVTVHNEIPLWIKLEKVELQKFYQLYISKRFRKIKVIKEWHKENEILPIIKKTTSQQSV